MKDKLSREILIEKLDWWRKIAHIGGGCKDKDICEQAYNQIKSLLTPIHEKKRNMLIEQWASEFSIDSRLDYLTAKELLNKAFKAYDNLREENTIEDLEKKENSLIEHEKGWLPKDKEEWEKESEND